MKYDAKWHATYKKSIPGRESRRRTRDKFRQYIFDTLGDRCVKCGFSDKRALQLDHKSGRNGEKKMNIDERYRFVKKNTKMAKKIYQVLCANCNFIKREEHNEHYYHGRKPIQRIHSG